MTSLRARRAAAAKPALARGGRAGRASDAGRGGVCVAPRLPGHLPMASRPRRPSLEGVSDVEALRRVADEAGLLDVLNLLEDSLDAKPGAEDLAEPMGSPQPLSPQPLSAEDGVDMEDTTFLYGEPEPPPPPLPSLQTRACLTMTWTLLILSTWVERWLTC